MSNEMMRVPREWVQHYADLLEECCAYEKSEHVSAFLANPDAGISASAAPFAEKVLSKLRRFEECMDDGQGADIGRDWFDVLTRLGLLNRVQRSPGLWEITQQGEDLLRGQPDVQHQAEPVAWEVRYRDGGVHQGFVTTQERADYYAKQSYDIVPLCTCPATRPVPTVPDGYCVMPKKLTTENGAKALLLGEFKLQSTQECSECREFEEPAEGCEICDGEGEYGQKHTIPWDLIKFIYSKAVEGLAIQPATDSSTSDKYKATLKDARAMLATVAECVTNECEDCKEHAQLKCAAIDGVLNSHTEGQSSAANDRWYAAEDVDRLVRELDVLINGEEGAAGQAKLCDIVAQVRRHERNPVVWLDPTSGRKANTISNALKRYNESKGGAPAVAAALYTVPLYARLAIVKG
ncbi:hypothetical protein K5F93_20235 [Pseudomonas protegens]|uniref:hypothetical protein n=1 Tax=Pseudomonas protegens TaxID=380021 RepID=UPI001C8E200F|nr:hypothetical protein [Pseudomonas protegens]QZI68714.1 hypothetical protein K5F93_20235 [Pseudomonas protegens]